MPNNRYRDTQAQAQRDREEAERIRRDGMSLEEAIKFLCDLHTSEHGAAVGYVFNAVANSQERYQEAWRTLRRAVRLPVKLGSGDQDRTRTYNDPT